MTNVDIVVTRRAIALSPPRLIDPCGSGPWMPSAGWIYQIAFAPVALPKNASRLYALANLTLLWVLHWWLHRRRWHLTV